MATRRALIVAPLYDGSWLLPIPGGAALVGSLEECLTLHGGYDVQILNGLVDKKKFLSAIKSLFSGDGELLFYFYGHGCLRPPGLGVFATSEASPDDEGVLVSEVVAWTQASRAREVVLILDCCHAGAVTSAPRSTFAGVANQLATNEGRAILAGCASNQQGWVVKNNEESQLGAFSYHVLRGLHGNACRRGSGNVRASVLGAYVTDVFQSWNQDPIVQTSETGSRSCTITSGFDPYVESRATTLRSPAAPLTIGIPFKPSLLFEGRSAEHDFLRDMMLDARKPIAVSATIEGLGGIGKTELVLQLLNDAEIAKAFQTILWLDGAGPLLPQWEKIANELEVRVLSSQPDEMIFRIGRNLRERGKSLIVLDNASDWQSTSKSIPIDIPLLVTTRTSDFGGSSFVHSKLGVLTPESATRFLMRIDPDLESDPHLPALVEALAGHALALELAGWNIKYMGLSAQEYLLRLDKHAADFPSALSATRYGTTVDACMSLTWDALKFDASRTLWRRAALFAPTSAHRDLLELSFVGDNYSRLAIDEMLRASSDFELSSKDLYATDRTVFAEAYAELRAFHVLSRVEGRRDERWAMHRLPRDFARARLQRNEVLAHALIVSEWAKKPTLPLSLEIPHLVAAIMDSARFIGDVSSARYANLKRDKFPRHFAREIFHSLSSDLGHRGISFFIDFIKDELRDPKALTMILEGLSDINEDVRLQSVLLLESIGPLPEVMEGLASSLEDPNPRVREQAGRTLAEHGGEKTIAILVAATRGDVSRARLAAVHALGMMGKKGHLALTGVLKSLDARVRVEAAFELCAQNQNEGVVVLREAALTAANQDAVRYLTAFDEIKCEPPLEFLLNALGHFDAAVRCLAVEIVGRQKLINAMMPLVRTLDDIDESVRLQSARSLKLFGDGCVVDRLVEVAKNDTSDRVRAAAVDSLHFLGKTEKTSFFLKSNAWRVRRDFAAILGQCWVEGGQESLVEALGDDNAHVRSASFRSLANVGGTNAVPYLIKFLNTDANHKVRKEGIITAVVLAIYGPKTQYITRRRLVEMGNNTKDVDIKRILATVSIMQHVAEPRRGGRSVVLDKSLKKNKSSAAFIGAILQIGSGFTSGRHKEVGHATFVFNEAEKGVGVEALSKIVLDFAGRSAEQRQECFLLFVLKLASLGTIFPSEAEIASLLEDGNSEDRVSVLDALGMFDTQSSAARLIEASVDELAYVRLSAAKAMGQMSSSSVRPRLAEMAKNDTSESVRETATRVLSVFGKGLEC